MTVDPTVVTAILAIFGIGVVGVVQALKAIFKVEGAVAQILTIVVSFGATAAYFLQAHTFTILNFVIYGIIVALEASGLYKVVTKSPA